MVVVVSENSWNQAALRSSCEAGGRTRNDTKLWMPTFLSTAGVNYVSHTPKSSHSDRLFGKHFLQKHTLSDHPPSALAHVVVKTSDIGLLDLVISVQQSSPSGQTVNTSVKGKFWFIKIWVLFLLFWPSFLLSKSLRSPGNTVIFLQQLRRGKKHG